MVKYGLGIFGIVYLIGAVTLGVIGASDLMDGGFGMENAFAAAFRDALIWPVTLLARVF